MKTPAPALQVAIWAGRPGCWNDSMVWKGGAVALCWHVSLTPRTPCLMGRGHSDSGTLQPGLRVIGVRTAQPLTLASTNKQSASKRTSLGNGTLCYPVQVLPPPRWSAVLHQPDCPPQPPPQLHYIISPGGDGMRHLQKVGNKPGGGRVDGWFLPSDQRTRGGKRHLKPGGESRVEKDDLRNTGTFGGGIQPVQGASRVESRETKPIGPHSFLPLIPYGAPQGPKSTRARGHRM